MNKTSFDDYWSREEFVARLSLAREYEQDIFFLWHQSPEKYGRGHREIGIKLTEAGERDYVHVKAVFYVPRIILTVGLTEPAASVLGSEIGQVESVRQEGQAQHEVANLQAWYYRSEKTLVLWEVDLRSHYAEDDPREDFVLSTLWHYFEEELLKEFPDCERIVTPGHEPGYDNEQYRAFLQERGYAPHLENTFVKTIGRK